MELTRTRICLVLVGSNRRRSFVAENPSLDTIRLTVLACPICRTSLYEITEGETSYLRCVKGHSFSFDDVCPGLEESFGGLVKKAVNVLIDR